MNNRYSNDEFLRKRKERQRKIRKRRLKIFSLLFVVVLLLVAVILSLTVFFPIKNITANGSKQYTQAEIVGACQIKAGDNLFLISKKDNLEYLKKQLPFVEDIEFERTLPDTVNIKVTDAKEFACYRLNDKYFTVSAKDWVLKSYTEKPKNVIEIVCPKVKCKIGSAVEFPDEQTHTTINTVIDTLLKNNLTVDSVDLSDKFNVKAVINGKFTVEFGRLTDLEPKIKHLKSMLKSIPENKKGKIDLSVWNSQNTQAIFVEDNTK